MKAPTTISVLGCGWLGEPLASRFADLGFYVKGSTTTPAKCSLLRHKGIEPYLFSFEPYLVGEAGDFFNSEILFVNIPFRRDLPDPRYYQEQMCAVAVAVARSKQQPWVILASSTLVYPKDGGLVFEDQPLFPDNLRAKILYDIENQWRHEGQGDATIIRFAGLYGPGRSIKDFIPKVAHRDPQAHVNLVHLDDCVAIIEAIVLNQARRQVFNAVSDGHPIRGALVKAAAIARGGVLQALPVLLEGQGAINDKIVSNAKIKAVLEYRFLHPDPMQDVGGVVGG